MDNILLNLENVVKRFATVTALDDVSLTLKRGEMLALLGHNGAGKTTLMKLILGLEKADSGKVVVLNHPAGRTNHAIGYVPENVNFYPAMTGLETLTYFARLNGLSRKQAKQVTSQLLESVHLTEARDRSVKQYSKGMKQRLGLAQALLPSSLTGRESALPELLILDEPTVGLDPVATLEFFQLLAELKKQGCGIIICTHVLPGLEQYIDTALILNKGKVVVQGSIDELHALAQLPVKVAPKGLNGSLSEDESLKPYLQQNGLLNVPPTKTLTVIEQLMQKENLVDLQITSPTLPELYQHFIHLDKTPTEQPTKGADHAQ